MISIDHPAAQTFLSLLDDVPYRRTIEATLNTPTPVWYRDAHYNSTCTTLTPEETQFLFAHWALTHD